MSSLQERIQAQKYRTMKRVFIKFVSIVSLGLIVLVTIAADYAGHNF